MHTYRVKYRSCPTSKHSTDRLAAADHPGASPVSGRYPCSWLASIHPSRAEPWSLSGFALLLNPDCDRCPHVHLPIVSSSLSHCPSHAGACSKTWEQIMLTSSPPSRRSFRRSRHSQVTLPQS